MDRPRAAHAAAGSLLAVSAVTTCVIVVIGVLMWRDMSRDTDAMRRDIDAAMRDADRGPTMPFRDTRP